MSSVTNQLVLDTLSGAVGFIFRLGFGTIIFDHVIVMSLVMGFSVK
jgi:hypothetical protein